MERIPFVDLGAAPQDYLGARRQAAVAAIEGGIYIGGSAVARFEDQWAAYVGVQGAVGVGNGLDALTIGLEALGIWPGARVAVPAHTFIATWISVLRVGGQPISVDVNAQGQIDVDELISMSPKPDFVIPVHMHGAMTDMAALMTWANANGVRVLEDASQAHGFESCGIKAGAWGHAAAFSLYPSKNLGALGDAGILVSNEGGVISKAKTLANYGSLQSDKYRHVEIGYNSRLDTIQAAVLTASLPFLDEMNAMRRSAAKEYLAELEPFRDCIRPLIADANDSVWHHFVIIVKNRDRLRFALEHDHGVLTEIHYPYLAADEVEQLIESKQSQAPRARKLASHCLSLPLYPGIQRSHIQHVVQALSSEIA